MTLLDLTTFAQIQNVHGKNLQAGASTEAAAFIPGVSRQIEQYLGIEGTYSEARTQVFNVRRGQRVFLLNTFPITTFTSLKTAYDRDFAGVTAEDADNYYVDTERGVLRMDTPLSQVGWGVLQAVHTGGLGTAASDVITNYPDIALACGMQVLYLMNKSPQFGSTSKGGAGGSVSHEPAAQLITAVKQMLDPYVRAL